MNKIILLLINIFALLTLKGLEQLLEAHRFYELMHFLSISIPVILTIINVVYGGRKKFNFLYPYLLTLLSIATSCFIDYIRIPDNVGLAWAGLFWGVGLIISSVILLLYPFKRNSINGDISRVTILARALLIVSVPALYWILLLKGKIF